MAEKGQKFKKYSKEYKLKAVKMYHEEGKGIKTIAKELGLKSDSYIQRWLKNYNEFGEEGLEERRGKTKSENRGRPKKGNSLEEEVKRLRMENEILKKIEKYFKEQDEKNIR